MNKATEKFKEYLGMALVCHDDSDFCTGLAPMASNLMLQAVYHAQIAMMQIDQAEMEQSKEIANHSFMASKW